MEPTSGEILYKVTLNSVATLKYQCVALTGVAFPLFSMFVSVSVLSGRVCRSFNIQVAPMVIFWYLEMTIIEYRIAGNFRH